MCVCVLFIFFLIINKPYKRYISWGKFARCICFLNVFYFIFYYYLEKKKDWCIFYMEELENGDFMFFVMRYKNIHLPIFRSPSTHTPPFTLSSPICQHPAI